MESAAMIFNGIYLSYEVADAAFEWAEVANGSLLAVFLSSKKETGEGYVYPSDLDAVEDSVSDATAKKEDEEIIQSNSLLLVHRAVADQIILNTIVLVNPSQKELTEILAGCTQIFVHENIEQPGIVKVESINLDKFLPSIGIPLKVIRG